MSTNQAWPVTCAHGVSLIQVCPTCSAMDHGRATLQAHTVWPPFGPNLRKWISENPDSYLAQVQDDGSSAETPEYGPTTFDEVSGCWTRAIPDALELRARIAVLEAELAKERQQAAFNKAVLLALGASPSGQVQSSGPAPKLSSEVPAKPPIPLKALGVGKQKIGLQMPVGF